VATKLALTTAPSGGAQSGVAFAQQPVVQLQDANGNSVSESGTTVTAVIATGPGGAALTNATAITGTTGAAAFSGLAINGPAGDYTLTFEATNLTPVPSGTITLSAASTATTITGHTQDPSVVGQGIAVTFTVTSNSGTPSGDVTVSDATDSCTGTVAAGTCTLTPTTAGAKTLIATYAGNTNFSTSASPGTPHTVNPAGTATSIAGHSPDPSVTGESVTFTFAVAVNPPGSGTPTGTVTVSDGTQSCEASVAAGSCSIAFSSAGVRTVTASYAGDASFNSSASSPVTQTVNQAPTATTIASVSPEPSTFGLPITVAFSVTSDGGTPTGQVTVSDGTVGCTATVTDGSCSFIPLAAGDEVLVATYGGDANFLTSDSVPVHHTVNLVPGPTSSR